jgi:hypothetical protein
MRRKRRLGEASDVGSAAASSWVQGDAAVAADLSARARVGWRSPDGDAAGWVRCTG